MEKIIKNVDKIKGIVQITTTDERWYVKPFQNKETGLPDYKYVPSVTWICSFYPKGVQFFKWLASKGWDEAEAIKKEAGEKGSKVHQAIEYMLAGNDVAMNEKFLNKDKNQQEELSLDEYECLMSFVTWYKLRQPKVLAIESVIFDEVEGFAGSVDLICELDGVKTIIDFKTGQYIWATYNLQLSAYAHVVGSIKQIIVLQLGYKRNKNRYKETILEDKYDLFLATKKVWQNECGGDRPSQKDYPLKLSLKVEEKVEKKPKIKK